MTNNVQVLSDLKFNGPQPVPALASLPNLTFVAFAAVDGKYYTNRLVEGVWQWVDAGSITPEIEALINDRITDRVEPILEAITPEHLNILNNLDTIISTQVANNVNAKLQAEIPTMVANGLIGLLQDEIPTLVRTQVLSALRNATSIGGIPLENFVLHTVPNDGYDMGEIGVTSVAGPGQELETNLIDCGSDLEPDALALAEGDTVDLGETNGVTVATGNEVLITDLVDLGEDPA